MKEKEAQSDKQRILNILENIVRFGTIIMICVTTAIVLIAVFDRNSKGEADIGSFESRDFNEGWVLVQDGDTKEITLPAKTDARDDEEISLRNTLPSDISDGMNIMFRSSMQDFYIYIDGVLRNSYSSDTLSIHMYHLPSAYIVTKLDHNDAGKPIEVRLVVKGNRAINEVSLGYGNNVWFNEIRENMIVAFIAVITICMGLFLMLGVIFVYRSRMSEVAPLMFLGSLVLDISIWILSESRIRQILFSKPSLSCYFAYFSVEMIAVLAGLYFDAVQHRVYHKRYVIAELIVFSQLIINITLQFTGICELYNTLILSHIMSAPMAVLAVVNTITDIRTGRIRQYFYNALGMAFFVIFTLCELVTFWINRSHGLGAFICIGLLLMMLFAVIQLIMDNKRSAERHEQNRTEMMVSTIETIAGAIDARDEYTGGHSERVGFYAKQLARGIADDYGLSDEDVFRFHYIGLVHDIGKIGVADNVLNKSGRRTAEEFSLMKKHTEIGYEVMHSLGEDIEGMLDGIRYHHERYDGTGYPDGLSGTDIPLVARVLAIADSYDAMTSNRVYRKRLTDEEVRNQLITCAGTQFDPMLSRIFVKLIDNGEIRPSTVHGISSDDEGKVYGSALLEKKLQTDLRAGIKISHPSHVRMLCYLMKLMEKKGKSYCLLFVQKGNDKQTGIIKKLVSDHDVNIKYMDGINVVAFYDRSDEEMEEIFIVMTGAAIIYERFW